MLRVRKSTTANNRNTTWMMRGLLICTNPDSNLFLKSIHTFNSYFKITSFGATQIINNNAPKGQQFDSTFKIIIQIYHKVGSISDEPHIFLQIYFMGGKDTESTLTYRVNVRC